MEKKFKVSEFAEIIGCTPKTVYKMIERNELMTVTEKVNHREATIIITNDKQLEQFRAQFGKLPVNNQECNEIVTEINGNEPVKNSSDNEIIEKVINLSREYTDRLMSVNNELITYKSQVLLLEDKQRTEKEALEHWQQEFYKKDAEVKTLQKHKSMVTILLTAVVLFLFTGIITLGILLAVEKTKKPVGEAFTGKEPVIEQPLTGNNHTSTVQPIQSPKKSAQAKKKK